MDELVAYAKKIYGVSGLPAGSFDNFISFIQEVTEAARASQNSLVVASIPESDIEIGGEAGKIALETIEHTFVEWSPSGNPLPQMRVLRWCAVGCSWTAKILLLGIWSARGSARCTWKIPATSLMKLKR